MSEQLPHPDNFDIPRRSPTVEARLNGEIRYLTWYDTTIVFYPDEYQEFNHLEVADYEQNRTSLAFNCEAYMRRLFEDGFPCLRSPEPTKDVLQAYLGAMSEHMPDSPEGLGN